jgi:hypothetical protein
MARCKTTAHKQVMKVRSSKHPKIDWMLERPSESRNNKKTIDYFPRELRSLLNALNYHIKPLYVGRNNPLRNKGYKWEVHMVLYEKTRGT